MNAWNFFGCDTMELLQFTLVLLLLSFGCVNGQTTACGDSSSWKYNSTSNMCYLLEKTQKSESDPVMSWQEVKEECERLSGNLVCPSTAAKHEEIVKMLDMEKIPTLNVWIGLLCKNNITWNVCYEWKWVDGSAYDNNLYKWANGEPGYGEKLARMRNGQWWATIDDQDARYYICEKVAKWIKLPPITSSHVPSRTTSRPRLTSPSFSPVTTTSQAATDQNVSGNKNGSKDNGKLTESKRNLSVLAVLILVVPVIVIATLVILFKKSHLKSCKFLLPISARTTDQNNDRCPDSHQERRNQESHLELKDYEHLKNTFLATADYSLYTPLELNEYEYIDITAIDSVGNKFGYIPTRTPEAGNVADFWRIAWDCGCDTIIMLCEPDQLGDIHYPYQDGDSCNVPPFHIECNLINPGQHISCRYLNVTHPDKEIRQFLHVHVLYHELEACATQRLLEIFLEIYHRMKQRKVNFRKNTPTIVHSLDGTLWTGLFCAFSYVLDQIYLNEEIDISKTLDLLRTSQTQFISSKKQHVKLVEMIFHFVKNQDRYSKILKT